MNLLLKCLTILFLINTVLARQDKYRAAVVEYAPKLTAEKPIDQLLENLQEYINYVEEAKHQGAQIIVFPEDGLTGWGIVFDENVVDEVSTEIPDASQQISPCIVQNANYSKALIDLSCCARSNQIYLAVNLVERRQDSENKRIYHNANVVFDRNGTVIAKYRKINLFNEDVFQPGNETVTFKTDFGVTFGMLICFDIMFQKPGLDILEDSAVTDIVYSVAWFSELPFIQALSVQHGYVKSTGVNFLASGMHAPETANGGSAIYTAGGKIVEAYISGTNNSKMIIQDVPIIRARQLIQDETYDTGDDQKITETEILQINSFHTYTEDMTNYTFKSLNLRKNHIMETVCNENSKFCCTFNITITKNNIFRPNYVYKLTAFHGSRLISLKDTIGVRNCGVVACLNESTTSCGERGKQPPKGIIFESISIRGTFNFGSTHDQPATLNFNLKPTHGYVFHKQKVGNKTEVVLHTTRRQNKLLTFGIHGRVFSNDNKPTGIIDSD